MIDSSNRVLDVELVQEANNNGTRFAKAHYELNISVHTYERWVFSSSVKVDQPPLLNRPASKNKLSIRRKRLNHYNRK